MAHGHDPNLLQPEGEFGDWKARLRKSQLDYQRQELEARQKHKILKDTEKDIDAGIAAKMKACFEKVAGVRPIIVADPDDTSTPFDTIDISSDSDQENTQRNSTRRDAKGSKDRATGSTQTSRSKVCISSSVVSYPSLSRLT